LVISPIRTVTISPACTSRPGLACKPLICTRLPRQALVASLLVLNARTHQSHLSRRHSCITSGREPKPSRALPQLRFQNAAPPAGGFTGAADRSLEGAGVLRGTENLTTLWRRSRRPLMLSVIGRAS
jgi:hypothetical protein